MKNTERASKFFFLVPKTTVNVFFSSVTAAKKWMAPAVEAAFLAASGCSKIEKKIF
jgi:hypothetical protein